MTKSIISVRRDGSDIDVYAAAELTVEAIVADHTYVEAGARVVTVTFEGKTRYLYAPIGGELDIAHPVCEGGERVLHDTALIFWIGGGGKKATHSVLTGKPLRSRELKPGEPEDLGASDEPSEEETKKMPIDPSAIKNEIKDNANEAKYRIGAKQLVKLVRDPVAALVARKLGAGDDESLRKKLSIFLMTDVGTAMLEGLLGGALSGLPIESETREKLARELRVDSMSRLGDSLADVVMDPLRQVITMYLKDMPEIEESRALPPKEEVPNDWAQAKTTESEVVVPMRSKSKAG